MGDQKVGEEENRVFIYQTEEQEVNQSDLAVCQVVVEDNPHQPGTPSSQLLEKRRLDRKCDIMIPQ